MRGCCIFAAHGRYKEVDESYMAKEIAGVCVRRMQRGISTCITAMAGPCAATTDGGFPLSLAASHAVLATGVLLGLVASRTVTGA